MELCTRIEGSACGITNYTIEPLRHRPRANSAADLFYPEDIKRMKFLRPRIERMARQKLGISFVQLLIWSTFLELRVKKGTSKNDKTKFELRNLFGWICLFDAEEKRVTKKH